MYPDLQQKNTSIKAQNKDYTQNQTWKTMFWNTLRPSAGCKNYPDQIIQRWVKNLIRLVNYISARHTFLSCRKLRIHPHVCGLTLTWSWLGTLDWRTHRIPVPSALVRSNCSTVPFQLPAKKETTEASRVTFPSDILLCEPPGMLIMSWPLHHHQE